MHFYANILWQAVHSVCLKSATKIQIFQHSQGILKKQQQQKRKKELVLRTHWKSLRDEWSSG